MAKKPDSGSSKKSSSQSAPQVQKQTVKNLTSKTLSDSESDKVAGGRASAYTCGINCSTSQDPT